MFQVLTREGIAEGVCDVMNSVNSIIDRALRSRDTRKEGP
jgi:hypothetical protein